MRTSEDVGTRGGRKADRSIGRLGSASVETCAAERLFFFFFFFLKPIENAECRQWERGKNTNGFYCSAQ